MKGLSNRNSKLKFIVSCLLVLAMFLSPTSAVLNNIVWAIETIETSLLGHTVVVENFQDEAQLGDTYELPSLKVNGASTEPSSAIDAGYVYEVKVPMLGKTLTVENEGINEDEDTGVYSFEVDYKTTYVLNISINEEDEISTVVEGLQIRVTAPDYSISLPVNSEFVVPETVPAGITLKIPAPIVYAEGEELDVYDESTNGEVVVSVYNSDDQVAQATILKGTGKNRYFEYAVPQNASGEQEIYYQFKDTNDNFVANTSKFFSVVSNKTFLENLELEVNWLSSKVVTAEVGKEITLPSASVINRKSGTKDAIEAYIEVSITHKGGKTIDASDIDGFKFTPRYLGTYSVTYKARIPLFEGYTEFKSATTVFNTQSISITDVKDSTDPTFLVVNPYTINEAGVITAVGEFGSDDDHVAVGANDDVYEMLGDLSRVIPTIVIWDDVEQTVSIPAIYAKDNYTTNFNAEGADLKRSFTTPNSGPNYAHFTDGDDDVVPVNQTATLKINNPGTYTIRYYAKDEAGNDTYLYYSIYVKRASDLENASGNLPKPIVEFVSSLPSQTLTNSKIVFAEPKVTDTHDLYPTLKGIYYTVKTTDEGTSAEYELTKNSDDKYVVDVESIINNTPLVTKENISDIIITATAINDYNNEPTHLRHTIKVYNSEDNVAPTLSFEDALDYSSILYASNAELIENNEYTGYITEYGYVGSTTGGDLKDYRAAFNQKDVITIPTVRVSDTDKRPLNVSVTVKNKYGKVVSLDKNSAQDFISDTIVLFGGGQFTAIDSGIYTITYRVSDIGGNVLVRTLGIRVNDNTAPIIRLTDESAFKTNENVGEFFVFPTPNLEDDGKYIEVNSGADGAGSLNRQIISYPGNVAPIISTNEDGLEGFIPTHHGTYVIRYTASDFEGNTVERDYSLTVVDNEAPKLSFLSGSIKFPEILKEWTASDRDNGKTVTIPFAIYNFDEEVNIDEVTEIKPTVKKGVTSSNSDGVSTVDVVKADDGVNWKFVAKTQGEYTIEYSLADRAGNKGTLTKKVRVGDCDAPELKWNDDKNLIPAKLKINDELTLPTDKFTVVDLVDANPTYTVELRNPDGTVVDNKFASSDEGYKWKFTQTGTYTLRIVVKDTALNTEPYRYEINVTADEPEEDKILTNTLGTILIVLSVVVLASIVIYFVVSNKKTASATKSKNTKDKK